MTVNSTISKSLRQLISKPAWGLLRSHGSMFLFDIESCTWRFEGIEGLEITSQDDPEKIESRFGQLELGCIIEASYSEASEQLRIAFDSGIALEVHTDPMEDDPEQTEWIFFIPGELAWGKTKTSLGIGSIYASSAPN